MSSGKYRIMVALVARGDEGSVVDQAVLMAEKFEAELIAFHVQKPVLSLPKGSVSTKVTDVTIRDMFRDHGDILKKLRIIIVKGDSISETVNDHINDIDMLIVGHEKMSDFKSSIIDSTDEDITNSVPCPVLVVQKD